MRNLAVILAAGLAASGIVACSDPVAPPTPSKPALVTPGTGETARASGLMTIYNVQVGSEPFAINVYFKYAGTGTPNYTAYTTLPGYTYYKTVPAKNMNNGYWLGRLEDMQAGTEYNLVISDGDKQWTGTAKTYRRQLTVDIDTIHVQYDGDPGPGCGELIFRTETFGYFAYGPAISWTHWHDLCTGDDLILDDEEGQKVFDNWQSPGVAIDLKSFESDDCWAWLNKCGQFGWAAQTLTYDVSGGSKFYKFQISSLDVSIPKVIWYGTVTTKFIPW
jgi:hypothetical protein